MQGFDEVHLDYLQNQCLLMPMRGYWCYTEGKFEDVEIILWVASGNCTFSRSATVVWQPKKLDVESCIKSLKYQNFKIQLMNCLLNTLAATQLISINCVKIQNNNSHIAYDWVLKLSNNWLLRIFFPPALEYCKLTNKQHWIYRTLSAKLSTAANIFGSRCTSRISYKTI